MRISDWSSDVCSSDLQPAKSGKTGNKHPGLDEIGARVFILVAADAASIDLDPGLRRRECKHGPGILPGRARNLVRNIAPGHGIAIKARGEHGANQRSDIFTHLCRYRQSRGCPCHGDIRSEEHTSELQSPLRISYAVFCLKKKTNK